jgi:hypothetical protein
MIHWAKVEVKGRMLSFTTAKDFKYDDIFVDRCDKIDNDPADFYVMLNRNSTHIVVISYESREHWTGPHRIFDRKKRYPVTLYSAPIEFVQFIELPVVEEMEEAA